MARSRATPKKGPSSNHTEGYRFRHLRRHRQLMVLVYGSNFLKTGCLHLGTPSTNCCAGNPLTRILAPNPITIPVQTKDIWPNHSDAACVERPVTGATPAIIIAGIRIETRPLVRRVALTERGRCSGKQLWRRFRYHRGGRWFLGRRYFTGYRQEYSSQK